MEVVFCDRDWSCYHDHMGLLGFWVVDVYKVRMNRGFLSLKYKRGRGVKEKEGKSISGSDLISGEDISYNVAKNTNGYPLLVLSSLGDHTVEKMTQSGNNKGTHDENMGQTPISSTVDPKLDVGNALVCVKLHGVPMTVFSEDCVSDITTKLGTPLMLDYFTSNMCMQSWVAMPKLVWKGFYTFTIRVEYEWKPPRYACSKVFGRVQDECPKNIGLNVADNLKKHSQAPRGVPVGPKMGFKLVKQVYRHVSKRIMPILVVIRRKMQSLEKRSSSSTTTTPIVEKFDGKLTLVYDEGKPLEKFYYSSDHNSEDEVEQVDNEMTNFLASKRVGYGTNSLLEQWRKTYKNVDYDYDHTMMICMNAMKFLTTFNLYAIIWISRYAVIRRNRLLEMIEYFLA
uniref:Zinc knuckle CX2CX4HX4C n=1 Tax=Tanacetum cinerariifolium TaxID=118510 RepID=A0A699H5J4_TANCI|nr:hypothetical protein [Tanacetum cinerariifolium]